MLTAVVSMNSREGGGVGEGGHGAHRLRYPAPHGLFLPRGNVCFTYDKVPLSTDHCSVYIARCRVSRASEQRVRPRFFFFVSPQV